MYDLRCKVWLEKGGRFVLGEGKAALLDSLSRTRSLVASSRELGMSYRHAWGMLRKMGSAVGKPVVRSVRGGPGRGTTVLTAEGERLLRAYGSALARARSAGRPALTVDGVVLAPEGLLLVRRGRPPFEGMHALPGGFVEAGETVERAVVREVREETGLRTRIVRLLGIYSDPARDPRGHTVSVVFELWVTGGRPRSGDDACGAGFFPLQALPPLAFDHERVVRDRLARK